MMDYSDEYGRRARWGITLGLIILLVGLLFGPSATISRDDLKKLNDDLAKRIDTVSSDLKATQTKVNGFDAQFSSLSTKLDATAKTTVLQEEIQKVLDGLSETQAQMDSLSQDAIQKLDELRSELAKLEKRTVLIEEHVQKLQTQSVVFLQDDLKDPEGNPICGVQSAILIQILNEEDAAQLREMGIDKNGDGIVCVVAALALAVELLQSP